MNMSQLLFSFQGRINRATLWKYIVPIWVIGTILGIIDRSAGTTPVISVIWSLVVIVPSLAVFTKRWHDRGKSGWWNLIALVPVVNLWMFIELGFLKGTEGENEYGLDPLGGGSYSAIDLD